MSELTVQKVVLAGLEPSYGAAAAGGDEFVNSGRSFIHVKNGGGSSIDVTVDSQTPCSQGYDHNAVVAVPAAGERMIGPFPKDRFNDANGKAQITYSGVTSVTIAAIEVP
jgi:hypothetical protein